MEKEPCPKIPEDVKTLAEAISTNTRVANRLWLFAALVTMYVIGAEVNNNDEIQFFNITMNSSRMYTVTAFLMALVNISYCSALNQAYYSSYIYSDLLKTIGAKHVNFSNNFTLLNVAYVLPLPTLSRMYPLTQSLPNLIRKLIYIPLKFTIDVITLIIPLTGLWVSSKKSGIVSFDILPKEQSALLYALLILIVFSSLGSLMMFVVHIGWLVKPTNGVEGGKGGRGRTEKS
jgi:hypothetical protein